MIIGLDHGVGKTQDLLRQSELENASRVSPDAWGELSDGWLTLQRQYMLAKYCSSWLRRPQRLQHSV